MYYRKTKDGQRVADKCGIGFDYASINDKVHVDDIHHVERILGMTKVGMELLFELEDAEEDAIRELDIIFEPYDDERGY